MREAEQIVSIFSRSPTPTFHFKLERSDYSFYFSIPFLPTGRTLKDTLAMPSPVRAAFKKKYRIDLLYLFSQIALLWLTRWCAFPMKTHMLYVHFFLFIQHAMALAYHGSMKEYVFWGTSPLIFVAILTFLFFPFTNYLSFSYQLAFHFSFLLLTFFSTITRPFILFSYKL